MGCGCGKSFSQPYATGSRRITTSHVPNQRTPTPTVNIQSKSLAARAATVQASAASASQGRRKV